MTPARIDRETNPVHRSIRWALIAGAAVLLAAAGPITSSAATTPALPFRPVECTASDIPVALAAGQPVTAVVVGELCTAGQDRASVVQLLMPGATYTRTYWDFPFRGDDYSYARRAAAAGIDTFAVDRLGSGQSTHLAPGSQITVPVDAFVAHQIVQALRGGSIGGTSYHHVVGVGHSLGSAVTWLEAATYHDVDGVVITGVLHQLTQFALTSFADFVPANPDPRFATLDSSYLTTKAGTRVPLFYNPADAEPGVIATDEATKDTFTASELGSYGTVFNPAVSQAITVPVLLVMGQHDALVCDATLPCDTGTELVARDASSYSAAACLRGVAVPGSGHDISLHRNNLVQVAAAVIWTGELLRPGGCGRFIGFQG